MSLKSPFDEDMVVQQYNSSMLEYARLYTEIAGPTSEITELNHGVIGTGKFLAKILSKKRCRKFCRNVC